MGSCSGMGFSWIAASIFILLLLYIFLVKSGDRRRGKTARDIVDERFARGEIDKEERDRMIKIIEGGKDES